MYDIHTHLYWESYDADRDEVIRRAKEAGVTKMFVIGCTVDESQQALELAHQYPELFAAVGIHPHEFNIGGSVAGDTTSSFLTPLQAFSTDSKVVAIGECGLDYFSHDKTRVITDEEKAFQKKGFEAQIKLALEKKLPVIVHCRDAYEDMVEILERYREVKAFILHCYMGDIEVTKRFLSLSNVFFSFTANITYPVKKALIGTKDDLTEMVKLIPLDRIFTETDCPFLSPQSKRGERNEPAFAVAVAEKICELQGKERGELEESINRSVQKVFERVSSEEVY